MGVVGGGGGEGAVELNWSKITKPPTPKKSVVAIAYEYGSKFDWVRKRNSKEEHSFKWMKATEQFFPEVLFIML